MDPTQAPEAKPIAVLTYQLCDNLPVEPISSPDNTEFEISEIFPARLPNSQVLIYL